MAITTNYSWSTPDDTALVKDGAAAIRTLGTSADTTVKNLNPETTLGDIAYRSSSSNVNTRLGIGSSGQVLTVAAGVPSWATPSDQIPLTTKGDIFTFSTVDARLAVGANTYVLTADSAEATGLKWAAASSGSMTLLSSGSISTPLAISSLSQSYKDLRIYIRNFRPTSNGRLGFRINSDATANIYASYYSNQAGAAGNETKWDFGDNPSNNSATKTFFMLDIYDYTNTTTMKTAFCVNVVSSTANVANIGSAVMNNGAYNSANAVTELQFICHNGDTTAGGTYEIYGVK